jgi:hypothetical protein
MEIYARVVTTCVIDREMAFLTGEVDGPPALGIADCRENDGQIASLLFADLQLAVPGLECRSEPCLDANVIGTFFTNGCLWAGVHNLGDIGTIGDEFHVYGLVALDGIVDARLVIPAGPRDRFWRMGSPLELVVSGEVHESPAVPAPVGGGTIATPPDMPADWAAKFAGASGTWTMRE